MGSDDLTKRISLTLGENITNLTKLGEGFGSTVFESNDKTVIRIAKNDIVQKRHTEEYKILKFLENKISGFEIPKIELYTETSELFPFGIMAYKKINGDVLSPNLANSDKEKYSSQIVDFLVQLHSINIPESFGIRNLIPNKSELEVTWVNIKDCLQKNFSPKEFMTLKSWWEESIGFWGKVKYVKKLVHADLWYENIIIDTKTKNVIGFIDFESAAFGDPCVDIMVQKYLSMNFMKTVIKQ